jgi:hypothetical protein
VVTHHIAELGFRRRHLLQPRFPIVHCEVGNGIGVAEGDVNRLAHGDPEDVGAEALCQVGCGSERAQISLTELIRTKTLRRDACLGVSWAA